MKFNDALKRVLEKANCKKRDFKSRDCSCEYNAELNQNNLFPHEITGLICKKKN